MRTVPVVMAVMALGVSFALVSGAGVGDIIFGLDSPPQDPGIYEGIEAGAAEASPESGTQADVGGDNEPTTVGIALRGGQFLMSMITMVAVLPVGLMRLGFPSFFAIPVGSVAQIIVFIGVIEFVTNREWT